ncbi:hypothetical protein QCA50_003958 [Cerrena zonata]|uniref:NAD(P)-binding protein n=1 Tax=Cerrena zonata TaxID=2478898 RepID=A0AAW0GFV2_9APHY
MSPRVWLITGTSTGLGRDMAELVLKKGEIVVATARKPEVLDDLKAKYPASQLLTVKLNVDNDQEIEDAFAKAGEAFGHIDVVFNNAGWGTVGETEAMPEDEARRIFDTNFWGAANVSREAVRFFREVNKPSGGLLLNNSSMSGIQSVPGMAYYSASKHALEGITQALALEIDPTWKIKVSLIEPGGFYTEGPKKAATSSGYSHPAYNAPTLPSNVFRAFFKSGVRFGADPTKGVQRIYDLSLLSDPPFRFVLGKDAVAAVRAEIKSIEQDVAKYETWSDGLDFDT